MRQIPIYKLEQNLPNIKNNIISYASEIISITNENWNEEFINGKMFEHIKRNYTTIAKIGDFDLHTMFSILASNNFNKNDDMFLSEELFAARFTAEDKPVNFMHEEKDIIGHIVGNKLVDENYKSLPVDIVVDELPEIFHILTNSVLYKRWSDPDLQDRMDEIIDTLANRFVSMECTFTNFDFATELPTGGYEIIPRNHSTAYLTKHLRAYGGSGVYKDKKIGRALRNITFAGKGLVDNPANPYSIIFPNVKKFTPILSDDEQIVNSVIEKDFYQRGNVMPDKDNTVELLQEQNAEYKSEMQNLTLQLADMQKQMSKSNIDALQKQIDDLDVALTKSNEGSEELKKKLDVANTEKTELSTKLVDTEGKVDELNTKFDKLEAEATKKDRLSALEAVGKTSDEAKALYNKFGSLDKDMFSEIVKTITASDNTDSETDKEIDKAEANADTQILDKLESGDDDVNLSVSADSEADEAKVRRLSLQKFVKAYWFNQDVSDDQNQEVN